MQGSKQFWSISKGVEIISRGAGGLSTLWNNHDFESGLMKTTQQWIFTELVCRVTVKTYKIINVYTLVQYGEKHDCWNELNFLRNSYDISNCIVAGDFNLVLSMEEKQGGIQFDIF